VQPEIAARQVFWMSPAFADQNSFKVRYEVYFHALLKAALKVLIHIPANELQWRTLSSTDENDIFLVTVPDSDVE
jgi:hypothetical protein